MRTSLNAWLLLGLLLATTAYCLAEEITLTTYYPSPRGVYQELRSTQSAFFAYQGGSVGIGTDTPQTKFEVTGEIKIGNTNLNCNNNTAGALRYDAAAVGGPAIEFCDGSGNWKSAFGGLWNQNGNDIANANPGKVEVVGGLRIKPQASEGQCEARQIGVMKVTPLMFHDYGGEIGVVPYGRLLLMMCTVLDDGGGHPIYSWKSVAFDPAN